MPVAFALGLTFASCSVYEPSLLTGEASPASARGGSSGKAGAAGKGGGAAHGGTPGTGGHAASGGGPAGGSSGTGGASSGTGGASSAGDSGAPGEAGQGAGGEGNNGAGGSSDAGSGGSAGVVGATGGASGSGTSGGGGRAGAGATGAAGDAGQGGSAGTGTAGTGGNAGGEACSGCARLSVPLASVTDQAHFLMTLPANTDFTSAIVTFRVLCKAGTGGQLRGYLQHGGTPDFAFLVLGITELADLSGWSTVSYELSSVTGFDKTVVRRVGLEVTGAGSSSWLNPTIVYLDSISIANTELDPSSFSFDDATTISTTPSSSGPRDQRLWLNDAVHDSNVPAALSWLGP